jgi:hypothetical protein
MDPEEEKIINNLEGRVNDNEEEKVASGHHNQRTVASAR